MTNYLVVAHQTAASRELIEELKVLAGAGERLVPFATVDHHRAVIGRRDTERRRVGGRSGEEVAGADDVGDQRGEGRRVRRVEQAAPAVDDVTGTERRKRS